MQIQETFWSIGGEVGQVDKGTRGQGDKGTRGQVDKGTRGTRGQGDINNQQPRRFG